MVDFVGAGPGAPDLITLRGQKKIEEADVIIYAGSLVNPALLEAAKPGCEIYDSAKMTLEEVIAVMERAEKEGRRTVRLHTGDPSVYGAIREQMAELEKRNIPYAVTPGVSSFCGAAAALEMEYTLPGVSQSLSSGRIPELVERLIAGGYTADTPAALVYKATWPEERKWVCTLGTLAQTAEENGIDRTALVIVGDVVRQSGFERSKLYDGSFTTGFREGK